MSTLTTDTPASALSGRRIALIVSGGIAAYKAADLVSRLRHAGASVRVAMTRAAREFVSPLTFETLSGHAVYDDVFARAGAWEMEHISWAQWAEAVVAAPATAHLLARLAQGLAADAPTTLALAFGGPVWVAPAMNTAMWAHPATQANVALLRARGVRVVGPATGALACGAEGAGRMSEPDEIVAALAEGLATSGVLTGRGVLVTAGPTREALDPIRFLSNRSTGRMGAALAAEAARRGARVWLVHGPMEADVPERVEAVPVMSAREMLEAVQTRWDDVDIAVFAAAVANYESATVAEGKIKSTERLALDLRRTPDIAAWAGGHRRPGQRLVGFSAETEDHLSRARAKCAAKGLDVICANAAERAFASATNQVTLLGSDDDSATASPLMEKEALAAWIWNRLAAV